MSNGIEKPKGKVWNISGSFTGSSNLIPEGATYTKLEVLPNSLDTYYDGELFRMDLTYFRATFVDQEGQETKIDIPSKQVDAKFDTNVPFSNNQETSIRVQLEFEWTYSPTEGEKQYHDCAFIITVWPEKFTVKKVEVIVPPSKTIYYDGETFEHNGMVVQATSEEGDTKEIFYCGGPRCSEDRDCYYYSQTPLHAGDSETVEIILEYCVPADGDHPNGYRAQFTYPVTVYRDERKPQLRVSYDPDTTKRLYYSGETLNTTGIKVEAKYPREDDSAYKDVSTECTYSILESSGKVLNYSNSNNGAVTLHIEYYDSKYEVTSTYDLERVIYVFEVDYVTPDTSVVSSKTYRAGDTFNKSDMPITITYKPTYDFLSTVIDNIDSIKINSKIIEKTSTSYSIVANQYINSSGTFLKSSVSNPSGAKTTFNYISPLDARSSRPSFPFEYTFYVDKKIYKVAYPLSTYTGECSENSQGVQALQYLNLFDGSGTQSVPREGIGKIEVQDMTGYTESVENNLTKYYKSSEGNYKWTVTTYLIEDTEEIHYVWDNYQQSTDPWVSTFTVKVNLTRQLQVTNSDITLTFDWNQPNLSQQEQITVSTEDGSSVSISTNGSSSYCTFQRTSSSSYTPVNYSFTIREVSGANSTYSATYTFSTTAQSSNEWSITKYSSATVRVTLQYINYTPPWAWTESQFNSQAKCNEWWGKFKANCTSSNWSSDTPVRVYRGSNTYMSFKATAYKNGYLYFISTQAYNMSSYGASSNKFSSTTSNYSYANMYSGGATNPQIACKTVLSSAQSYCSNWYSAVDTRSQTFPVYTGTGGSSVTCSGRNSAKLWIPSYEEIMNREESTGNAASVNDCPTSGNGAYSGTDKTSFGVFSGDTVSSTIWIRNGSYVDGSDSTLMQMCACTLTGSTLGRWNAKSSQTGQIHFCFRISI